MCGKFVFPVKIIEVLKLHRETREPTSIFITWKCEGHVHEIRRCFAVNITQIQTEDILILLRYSKNTTKSWKKELAFHTPKLQPSTGKLGFNSRLIVQMETKTKSGRDNTWTGFCIFREPDSSSIQLHTENLFHVKISISSYLSDTCCEK